MKRALVGIVTAASMGISFLSIAQGIAIKDIQTIVGGEKPIRNCSDESYLSIPISIGDPSRVYISTNVTSVASRVTLWATLTNASGVVLGSLPSVYNEPTTTTLSLSGLFHSGAVLVDKTADDLILSDGNYTINVMIRSQNCGVSAVFKVNGVLTYWVVDATQRDLIFKNGFEQVWQEESKAFGNKSTFIETIA